MPMSDQQYQQQEQQRRKMGLPPNMDPRRAMNAINMEKVAIAQAAARAEAAAASTVVIATVVSLVTSAFGFVAALAWNDALTKFFDTQLSSFGLTGLAASLVHALVVTVIAVIAVTFMNRITSRIAKKSAIEAAKAG
ncbi:MAG TPA: DUF5654 family protein [Ktedonobacterales bacterium]